LKANLQKSLAIEMGISGWDSNPDCTPPAKAALLNGRQSKGVPPKLSATAARNLLAERSLRPWPLRLEILPEYLRGVWVIPPQATIRRKEAGWEDFSAKKGRIPRSRGSGWTIVNDKAPYKSKTLYGAIFLSP